MKWIVEEIVRANKFLFSWTIFFFVSVRFIIFVCNIVRNFGEGKLTESSMQYFILSSFKCYLNYDFTIILVLILDFINLYP